MQWLSRFSYYRRLQFSFLALILLPFTAVTLWSYQSVRQNVSDKILRTNEETITVIANQIEKTIDTISFASLYLSETYDPEVLNSLRYLTTAESFGDYGSYIHQAKLKSISGILTVQALDADLEIMIVNRKDRIIMSSLNRPVFSRVSDRFLQETGKLDPGEETVLQWFLYRESGPVPEYCYAARFIIDPRNHEKLGTLFIGIPRHYFEHLLDTGNASIVLSLENSSGDMIAVSRGSEAAVSGKPLRSEVRIARTGWLLASELPRSSIDGQINREFLVSLSIVIVFLVAFLVLSMFWARYMNEPIRLLRASVKQYVGGNRDVRIPVKGKDEVAVLSLVFNQMLEDIDELLHRVESEQEERRRLELRALSAQIRPHFLLNTLNSIKVNLLMSGDSVHSAMLDALMKLQRAYVHADKPLKLSEECAFLGSYVQVMQIRNRLDIAFEYFLEPGTEELELPRLLLQPVVENAIAHGFSARPERPWIGLSSSVSGGMLEISITDNGRGMDEEAVKRLNRRLLGAEQEAPQPEKGVGLVNTARRLQVLYGFRSRLTAAANPGGGMIFTFCIPVTNSKEGSSHDDGHAD
ncbi:Sensor histidine kinase YpdA [compost metagenome]